MATTTTKLHREHGRQSIDLPPGFQLDTESVSLRREGHAVVIEPLEPANSWPAGFFDSIRIDDPAFNRPDQGAIPPTPSL